MNYEDVTVFVYFRICVNQKYLKIKKLEIKLKIFVQMRKFYLTNNFSIVIIQAVSQRTTGKNSKKEKEDDKEEYSQ